MGTLVDGPRHSESRVPLCFLRSVRKQEAASHKVLHIQQWGFLKSVEQTNSQDERLGRLERKTLRKTQTHDIETKR